MVLIFRELTDEEPLATAVASAERVSGIDFAGVIGEPVGPIDVPGRPSPLFPFGGELGDLIDLAGLKAGGKMPQPREKAGDRARRPPALNPMKSPEIRDSA